MSKETKARQVLRALRGLREATVWTGVLVLWGLLGLLAGLALAVTLEQRAQPVIPVRRDRAGRLVPRVQPVSPVHKVSPVHRVSPGPRVRMVRPAPWALSGPPVRPVRPVPPGMPGPWGLSDPRVPPE